MNVLPDNNAVLEESIPLGDLPASSHAPEAESPLTMMAQHFDRNFVDKNAPVWQRQKTTTLWRFFALLPAFLITFGFAYTFYDFFKAEGINALEIAIMALTSFAFVWIAIAVGFSVTGAIVLFLNKKTTHKGTASRRPLTVALLAPMHNEHPSAVFGNVLAALNELTLNSTIHDYALYFLSDSTDPAIQAQETVLFEKIKQEIADGQPIYYRHRPVNRGRKAGNIADWCRRWGASHDAFLVLDADSQMSAECIDRLANEIGQDPALALAQSAPRLIGATSLFARLQQFATATYGGTLAAGIAKVYGNQSSYWGHNAMIRTRAFVNSAGLPTLPGRAPLGGPIMSHDFVEAALLCRAGWKVRMFPDQEGSYEGTPQTLIDYCIRDRRWCQGNLQHLRVLAAKKLRPISRFQLFQGAMIYVAPLAWLLLLVVWAIMGYFTADTDVTYFREANPMMPFWPGTPSIAATTYLAVIYGMLLIPKIIGAFITLATNRIEELGGFFRFSCSILVEIVLSVLLAPILMVQQSKAVISTLVGLDAGWKPQNRNGSTLPMSQIFRFHLVETVLGSGLAVGMAMGFVSIWLLPIMASLLFSSIISWTCSLPLGKCGRTPRLLGTYEDFNEPRVSRNAHRFQQILGSSKA